MSEVQLTPLPVGPSSPEVPVGESSPLPPLPLFPPEELFSDPELFPSVPEELPEVASRFDPPVLLSNPELVVPDPPQATRSPAKAALSQSARPLELSILTVSRRPRGVFRHEIANVPAYQCAVMGAVVARVST